MGPFSWPARTNEPPCFPGSIKPGIPAEDELERDLLRFSAPLAKLYEAQETGVAPGAISPDLLALREEVEKITNPLKLRATAGGKGGGQGRGLTAGERKLVELHAMGLAREWLKENGFDFEDVSAKDSCDFRAAKAGEMWVVEVKGTTGGPGSVLLTRNEVALHRDAHPRNALLVVHGISLGEGRTTVSGGTLLALAPWSLQEERLTPVCYEYRIG